MSIEAFVKKNSGQSNYELQKHRAEKLLAAHDLQAAAERMGLACDESYVYLRLFDLFCRVRIADGFAECSETAGGGYREADFNTAMTLFDLLGYAEPDACPSGWYAKLESFSRVQNARSFAGEGAFSDTEREFDRVFEKLPSALEALGAAPYGKGDLSYRIPMFRELCMVLSFWQADEEFPASLSVMFDCNTTKYLHYETMWYAAGLCIRRVMSHL